MSGFGSFYVVNNLDLVKGSISERNHIGEKIPGDGGSNPPRTTLVNDLKVYYIVLHTPINVSSMRPTTQSNTTHTRIQNHSAIAKNKPIALY